MTSYKDRARKAVYRAVRYNRAVEWLQAKLRRTSTISFDAIGLSVTLKPGDIVIDCGANVGDVASRFARSGATIYAFEPQPDCFAILQRRFAWTSKVRCFNQAVLDHDCRMTLATPQPNAEFDAIDTTVAASLFTQSEGPVTEADVECIDLGAFIDRLSKPVSVLKLDVEGAEIPVLNHLLDTGTIDRVKLALVETHERCSDELARGTEALKKRIGEAGRERQIRLDWW